MKIIFSSHREIRQVFIPFRKEALYVFDWPTMQSMMILVAVLKTTNYLLLYSGLERTVLNRTMDSPFFRPIQLRTCIILC